MQDDLAAATCWLGFSSRGVHCYIGLPDGSGRTFHPDLSDSDYDEPADEEETREIEEVLLGLDLTINRLVAMKERLSSLLPERE
jgi:hypothetical protein